MIYQEFCKYVREIEKPSQSESFESEMDGYLHQLEMNGMSLRRANAASSKLISNKAKDALFSISNNKADLKQRQNVGVSKMDKNHLANESSAITDNLRAVSRMLADQVSQSEHTLHSLVNSSAVATETHEEFKTMGNVLVHSKKLLTKYGRREVTDKVLIFLALAFFFACVIYVVMKRLF
jgi:protein transport protein SEC20